MRWWRLGMAHRLRVAAATATRAYGDRASGMAARWRNTRGVALAGDGETPSSEFPLRLQLGNCQGQLGKP